MADETSPSPAPSVPQTVPHTPAVAIWSLILAVLSFTCGWLFTAIPAVICGHVARSKIRKSGGVLGGRGIATAGLILGYIALAVGIMGIPLFVSMIHSDRERLQRLSTERKEIASDDAKIKVTVPQKPFGGRNTTPCFFDKLPQFLPAHNGMPSSRMLAKMA